MIGKLFPPREMAPGGGEESSALRILDGGEQVLDGVPRDHSLDSSVGGRSSRDPSLQLQTRWRPRFSSLVNGEEFLAEELWVIRGEDGQVGSFECPGGEPVNAPKTGAVYFLGVKVEGKFFAFLDLDTAWEVLRSQEVISLYPGNPIPTRVVDPQGQEVLEPIRLSRASSGNVRVDGGILNGLDAQLTSPLVLPSQQVAATLECSTATAWARLGIPAIEPPSLVGALDWSKIELNTTFDVELAIHAPRPVTVGRFHLNRTGGAEGSSPGNSKSVEAIELTRDRWSQHGEADWRFSMHLPAMLPGLYRPYLLGLEGLQGLELHPQYLEILPDSSTKLRIDLMVDPPAVPGPAELRLDLPRPLEECLGLAGGKILCQLVARGASQWVDEQPAVITFNLNVSQLAPTDDSLVVLKPNWSRGVRFASGLYDLVIRPIGLQSIVDMVPNQDWVVVEVPSLGAVRLVGDSVTAPAGLLQRLRITGAGSGVAGLTQNPVAPIQVGPGFADYLLVFGDYRLHGIPPISVEPREFEVSSLSMILPIRSASQARRRIVITKAGVPTPISIHQIHRHRVYLDGKPLEDSALVPEGFDFASETLGGFLVTSSEAGLLSIEVDLEFSGLGMQTFRLEEVEFSTLDLPAAALELNP